MRGDYLITFMADSPLRVKTRIKTSKNIAQITRAMEMVSASKMRRAQNRALAGMAFSRELADTLLRLTEKIESTSHPLLISNADARKTLYIIFSTDKGLTGGLNTNLFNFLEKKLKQSSNEAVFITVGKKARDYVAKTGRRLLASFDNLPNQPTSDDVAVLNQMVIEGFEKDEYELVNVVYSEFESTLVQIPYMINLLPLGTPEELEQSLEEAIGGSDGTYVEYLFEPDPNTVLSWLLPYYVENRLYQLLLESLASEHSARMVAMKNASENAKDIVSDLTLVYNQARQAKVTNELLDAFAARLTVN